MRQHSTQPVGVLLNVDIIDLDVPLRIVLTGSGGIRSRVFTEDINDLIHFINSSFAGSLQSVLELNT